MTGSLRQNLLGWVTALGLVVAVLWAYGMAASARESAADAAVDVAQCRLLAGQIQSLRSRPVIAGDRSLAGDELHQRVEQAAQSAGLPLSSIVRIAPDPPRRVGQSQYDELVTQVSLKPVSLRELVGFLYSLGEGQSGLRVKSLRLSAPREAETGGKWSAETALSYTIFAPRNGSLDE